jgi:hypothetical protein
MNRKKQLMFSSSPKSLDDLIKELSNNSTIKVVEEIDKIESNKTYSKKVYSNGLWEVKLESAELLTIIYSARLNGQMFSKKELIWKVPNEIAELSKEVKGMFHQHEMGVIFVKL